MPVGVYARPRRKGPLAWPTAEPVLIEPERSSVVLTDDGDVTVSHRMPHDADYWSCPECEGTFRRERAGYWVADRGRAG